jgi:two-component system, OmpR family, sensor histidine kinase KdpD
MISREDIRPDPDELLKAMRREERSHQTGRLKVFFGMCAGVGKTYEMLKAAHEEQHKGVDVVVGYVETHGREETLALVNGLEVIPRQHIDYRGALIDEMDIDAILRRKPALVLIDELAHTNAPGSRHPKRYQDVLEILERGIHVFTTLNVQHLESRADTVAQITGAPVRETVPDSIFARADEVEVIDIPPDELLQRLADGKVYTPERSVQAREHFFRKGNLTALREMALRLTAERVDHQLREYMRGNQIAGPWKSGQRLVVAIGPSPHSGQVVRWARRTAYTLNATWVAVYVELPPALTEGARTQLDANIRLARELGAEVVTTADTRIDRGLLRVARQEHATHVLIGRSSGRTPFWRKSLFDRLLEESSGLDLYVVGAEVETRSAATHWLLRRSSTWKQYAAASAIVCLVAALCFPVTGVVGYQTVSLVLLLTITLLSLRLHAGPVLLAAALSAAIWDFFFIPPLFTIHVDQPVDMLMLVTYFMIAIVTGVLSARSRASEEALRYREERASALFSLTKDLSQARNVDEVIGAAVANLKRHFDADAVVMLSTPDGDLTNTPHAASIFSLDSKEFSVAAWTYWNEKRAGRFTDTLPSAQATYYPLSGPRYSLGVIGVRVASLTAATIEQETLLQNFMDQIASALERENLSELSAKAMVLAESERLYKALFDSISHEMKTPLAAIAGSAEALIDEAMSSQPDVRAQLARDVFGASQRLTRLVENLLDMTRLESGLIRPRLDWCDVADILRDAARRVEATGHDHPVTLEVQNEMPLVRLDYGLIEQAVVNILQNAVLYSPPGTPIALSAMAVDQQCLISVKDQGPGIPAGKEEMLFEKFYRVPGTPAGGTGLGLSIVRGFARAHGGTVTARNVSGGGSEFIIQIPLDSSPSATEHTHVR